MTGKLLKKLCHQHGILTTGNTDCNLISILHQFIFPDCLSKASPDRFAEFLDNTAFNIFGTLLCFTMICHQSTEFEFQPCTIAVFDTVDLISLFRQFFRDLLALLPGITEQVDRTILTDLIHMLFKLFPVNIDRIRISFFFKICFITDINHLFFPCILL